MSYIRKLDKIKEKVDEWLAITGAISKHTGWHIELMCFFDDEVKKALTSTDKEAYRRGRESMRDEAAKIASNLDCEGCYAEHVSSNYPPGFFDYNKAEEAIRSIKI